MDTASPKLAKYHTVAVQDALGVDAAAGKWPGRPCAGQAQKDDAQLPPHHASRERHNRLLQDDSVGHDAKLPSSYCGGVAREFRIG